MLGTLMEQVQVEKISLRKVGNQITQGHSWEDPDQWSSTLFPTNMYSLDPPRVRRRGSQVCSIGKVVMGCVQSLELLGSLLLSQIEKLRPSKDTTYPFLIVSYQHSLGLQPFFSSSGFSVFIFHYLLLSLKRQSGLHLCRRAQPGQRHSGRKGQGVSEDGTLWDKAGLQGVCVEKVVGESPTQRVCIEHLLYARHCQYWRHSTEQNRQNPTFLELTF